MSFLSMQKRGQVTIYIIVGIVILVVFGMLFFFKDELIKGDFQSELEKIKVPEQIKPIKNYIDDCITETVLDGADIIGFNGGYLETPSEKLLRSVFNPFSNSLELGSSNVAYWYYKSANNLDRTQIPTKESMEKDLEKYINENFDFCLKGMDNFLEEGFDITQYENTGSEVNIKDSHIEVRIFAPTDINKNGVGMYFDKHLADVQVNLGKLYELALEIYEEEQKNAFLEDYTMDMMVAYDDIPFSKTEFTCERLVWQKSEVEENFRNIAERNLGALRLKGSDYIKTLEDNNYFEVNVNSFDDVTTNFEYYHTWPFEMDVTPSKGDIMIGDSITQANPEIAKFLNLFFCLNNYHFIYDVKYPVLISLEDDKGFSFQFANMVVLDNNAPRTYEGEILDYGDDEVIEHLCENTINAVDLLVMDKSNSDYVGGADITYSCFSSSCYIGKTDNGGNLYEKYPACLNGKLHVDKQGYYSDSTVLSTTEDSQVSLYLEPYYNLDVEIKAVELRDGDVRELKDGEVAIFQLENLDNDYKTMVTNGLEDINLVAGTYMVTTYLMNEGDPVKIKGEKHTECVDVPRGGLLGVFLTKEECFEVETEDMEVDSFITGGGKFEFTLDYGSLENSEKIIFYAISDFVPSSNEDMIQIFESMEEKIDNENFRYPELK